MNTQCECKGIILHAHKTVLCVCGHTVHRQCGQVIDGAIHGPQCARLVLDGGKVSQVVPAT